MRLASLAVAMLALLFSPGALAWTAQAHQLIGSLAEQFLHNDNPALDHRLRQLLGPIDLAAAASWADCVRDVTKNGDRFIYRPTSHTPKICRRFQTPAEIARMQDYVRRNWSNCPDPDDAGCLALYRDVAIPIERGRYDRAFAGTSDHDVVSAITAAILVLQGQAAPRPFSIVDRREALLLLAGFVGDLHQPLSVGAVYLDPAGALVDPDDKAGADPATDTRHGTRLFDGTAKNLRAEWDDVPANLGNAASDDLFHAAGTVPATSGPVENWAKIWADDTMLEVKHAFAGLSFVAAGPEKWSVHFDDTGKYRADMRKAQIAQIQKAGSHLAEIIEATLH